MWSKADSVGKFVVDTLAVKLNGTPITNWTDTLDASGNKPGDGIPDVFQGNTPAAEKFEVNGPAFYIWPTVLDVAGQKTEIIIEGAFGSDKRLYKLDLAADVKIEANKVYRIKVMRQSINMVKFALEVDDWYDIEEIEANGNDKSLSYVDVPVIGLTAPDTIKLNGSGAVPYTYSATNSNPVKLSFETVGTVKDAHHNATSYLALSPVGVVGVDYLQSDWDALEAAEDAVTYTTTTTYASQYVTKYELNLPPTDAPITVKLKIINAANSAEAREIDLTSDNVNQLGKPLMQLGQVLDASTAKLGQGRWQKAVVTQITAPTTTLPSKYDNSSNTYGAVKQVYALLGGSTNSSYRNFAEYNCGGTITGNISYLNSNCGGSAIYKTGETFTNFLSNGNTVVPGSLMPTVASEFGLAFSSDGTNAVYKAIIVNYNKSSSTSSNPQFPALASGGGLSVRTDGTAINGSYGSSKITALINY
jgi:hypothetical protein